jgi:hypothetical protein
VTLLTEPEPEPKEDRWRKIESQIKNFTFVAPARDDFGDESNVDANKIYEASRHDPAFAKARELLSQIHPWAKNPVRVFTGCQ